MAGITQARMDQAIGLVEECLLEGFRPPGFGGPGRGAIQRAAHLAVERGWADTTNAFEKRIYAAKAKGQEPDWTKFRTAHEIVGHTKATPILRIPNDPEAVVPDGDPVRVFVIGDTHCCPTLSNERFTWLGRAMAERRPEHVVQIGDFGSWDSVSAHEGRGTAGAMARPSISEDFAANQDALARMTREQPDDWRPRKDLTLGNHEHRVIRYENQNPELGQHLSLQLDEMFLRHGWRTREFGAYRFIGGVGFTHAPLNGMGKPFGGVTGTQRAGANSNISLVHGHTHKRDIATVPKIGGTGKVEVVSVGCALPHGHIEAYTRHSPTAWFYGAVEMIVQGGEILDMDWISMLRMRERYSDDGGDIRSNP